MTVSGGGSHCGSTTLTASGGTGGTIYWRCNPGITHDNMGAQWIDFYPWTEDKLREFATALKCTVVEMGWDHLEDAEPRWGNRIYSEWRKGGLRTR